MTFSWKQIDKAVFPMVLIGFLMAIGEYSYLVGRHVKDHGLPPFSWFTCVMMLWALVAMLEGVVDRIKEEYRGTDGVD